MNNEAYEEPSMIIEEATEWQRRFLELYVQNEDLRHKVKEYQEAMKKVEKTLYNIGGPLNDNRYGYTKDQLYPFFRIAEIVKC